MVLAFLPVPPVLFVIALVGVEQHDRVDHPQVIGDPALLVAAPAVQNLLERHPRLAVVKFVDGNQIVEVLSTNPSLRRIPDSDRDQPMTRLLPST